MKRIAARVVVFLLLLGGGAIVNVVVAWGCELTAPKDEFGRHLNLKWQGDGESLSRWMSGNDVGCYFRRGDSKSITVLRIVHERIPMPLREEGFHLLPSWGDVQAVAAFPQESGVQLRRVREVLGAGWPRRTLWCEIEHDLTVGSVTTPERRRGGWHYAGEWHFDTRFLPLFPIWPGFAINTIFYAAILWVVFFVPGMVRRTIRRRRGLCPACAYPIGTSPVCTECGNPLKIRTCMGLPPPATPATDTERTT